jgi:hypothetical protein
MVNETEVTMERAAQLTGFTHHHLERLIKAGILKTQQKDDVRMIDLSTLEQYSEKRAQKKAAQPTAEDGHDSEETIVTGGVKYVSVNRAARLSSYSQTHIRELADAGDITTKYFGERLYVSIESLFSYRRVSHSHTHMRAVPSSQKQGEPVAVHRVSIYSRDDAPVLPPVAAKSAATHGVAIMTQERPTTETKVQVRESTPSPFIVSPRPAQEVLVRRPTRSRAEQPAAAAPAPVAKKKKASMFKLFGTTLSIAVLLTSVWFSAVFGLALISGSTQSAERTWLVAKILSFTEMTIPYYNQ